MPSAMGDDSRNKAAPIMEMLRELASGNYDSITCPKCGKNMVSAWFTNPRPDKYWTWLVCNACDMRSTAASHQSPPGFLAERIHPKLQALDEDVVRRCEEVLKRIKPESDGPAR